MKTVHVQKSAGSNKLALRYIQRRRLNKNTGLNKLPFLSRHFKTRKPRKMKYCFFITTSLGAKSAPGLNLTLYDPE